MTMALIIGVFAVLIIFLVMAFSGQSSGQNPAVPTSACGDKALRYINQNLVQQGTSATLLFTSETQGVYEIRIQYQSQEMKLYATRDCSRLFTSYYDMDPSSGTCPVGSTASNCDTGSGQATRASQPAAPVKSSRPVVDLYVMAFCPYGTQAEAVMRPVVDLLGSKTGIRLRYITTVTGTTADSVSSLHGPTEAQEDLRQICIQKYYPAKLWDYITRFNEECFPQYRNSEALLSCWKNASVKAGIDISKIEACASGQEGISLLKADETDSNKNRASGSPTLIINGVTYSGARTPEAYKQAICNSFESAPAECNTTLSGAQAANSAGGCG